MFDPCLTPAITTRHPQPSSLRKRVRGWSVPRKSYKLKQNNLSPTWISQRKVRILQIFAGPRNNIVGLNREYLSVMVANFRKCIKMSHLSSELGVTGVILGWERGRVNQVSSITDKYYKVSSAPTSASHSEASLPPWSDQNQSQHTWLLLVKFFGHNLLLWRFLEFVN